MNNRKFKFFFGIVAFFLVAVFFYFVFVAGARANTYYNAANSYREYALIAETHSNVGNYRTYDDYNYVGDYNYLGEHNYLGDYQ